MLSAGVEVHVAEGKCQWISGLAARWRRRSRRRAELPYPKLDVDSWAGAHLRCLNLAREASNLGSNRREAVHAMRYASAILICGLLLPSVDAAAQQKPAPAEPDRQLRVMRKQLSVTRKQLNEALSALSAEATARRSIQMQLGTLQTQMDGMKRQLNALAADVGGLKANSVWDLNGYLVFDISNGYPTALFRGVNVQIVNGMGETQTVNGTGNLVIGYNRPSMGEFTCSVGVSESASLCAANGAVWAQSHKSGSHNLIGGDLNNYSSWGALVFGLDNTSNAPYTAIVAGARNRAESGFASIGGGARNAASGLYSSISGGFDNRASGHFATVGGGAQRSALGTNNWAAGALLQSR